MKICHAKYVKKIFQEKQEIKNIVYNVLYFYLLRKEKKTMVYKMKRWKMEKWSCRNPLTIEDRRVIQHGIKIGLSSREIAKKISRVKSVVLRESKRLGDREKYNAEIAQQHFEDTQRKGWEKCRQTKLKNSIKLL